MRRVFSFILGILAGIHPALGEIAALPTLPKEVLPAEGESSCLYRSPDGHHAAYLEYMASGALSVNFRVFHERGGQWYASTDPDCTHCFCTRYGDVESIDMTNDAVSLTVVDEEYGITFIEKLPLGVEHFSSNYRTDRMLRRHPLHEAALENNARHVRLLLDSGKVNPRLLDFEGRYAWELAEDSECRELLLRAAGTPDRAADAAATLSYLRGLNEDYAFTPGDLAQLETLVEFFHFFFSKTALGVLNRGV